MARLGVLIMWVTESLHGVSAEVVVLIGAIIALTPGIVLVISYMLKDRIKDLLRYYFAHKLGNKYYDKKRRG